MLQVGNAKIFTFFTVWFKSILNKKQLCTKETIIIVLCKKRFETTYFWCKCPNLLEGMDN